MFSNSEAMAVLISKSSECIRYLCPQDNLQDGLTARIMSLMSCSHAKQDMFVCGAQHKHLCSMDAM